MFKQFQAFRIPLPIQLEQFVQNMNNKVIVEYTKQLSPRFLFDKIVNYQINKQTDIIVGENNFGMYSDAWIFNAAAFQLVLPEMMIFFKFRNAIVSSQKFDM